MNPAKLAFSVLGLVSLSACHRSKSYEANVDVDRMSVVRRDEAGTPMVTDLELSYRDCPGDQLEVIRGGQEFSQCVSKYKIGDKLKIKVQHRWDKEGHYRWDVVDVGGCKRTIDPDDEASYAMIRECEDWSVNGAVVGFKCNVAPQKSLLKSCPWFAKH
jgi:hypothetical protein